ncbi:MAG: MMPL family transporter [Chloroflexota bacterium]
MCILILVEGHPSTSGVFGRAGYWIYRYHRWVIGVWVVLILVCLPFAPGAVGRLQPGGFSSPTQEAQRASDVLQAAFQSSPATLVAVYSSDQWATNDPRFAQAVDVSLARVRALSYVASVTTARENALQAASDGRTAYASIALNVGPEAFRVALPAVKDALQPTELDMVLTGAPVFYSDILEVTERDLRRAELISFPFAGLALVLIFGSLVAAALPAVVGGAAVVTTLGALTFVTNVTDLSIFALNLITMLGLGLGIDYSLFIVSRFREERALADGGRRTDDWGRTGDEGRRTKDGRRRRVEDRRRRRAESRKRSPLASVVPSPSAIVRPPTAEADALAITMSTAGRAVLFSGLTVLLGLLGLMTFDLMAMRSLGIAGAIVVALCVLAALTLLPAALAVLGPRVDAFTVIRPPQGRSGLWQGIALKVMARPWPVFSVVVLGLLLLGAPFLRVDLGAPDASILPKDVQSRQGFDLLRDRFGAGEIAPILVVIRAQDTLYSPDRIGALVDFSRRLEADPRVARVDSMVTLDPRITREQYQLLYRNGDRAAEGFARAAAGAFSRDPVTLLRVVAREGQTTGEAKSLVRSIRSTSIGDGLEMLVGGGSAGVVDYVDALYADFPRALALVVGATYLVLLWTFRSVVLPLKAILMNALSITASYGALVVVFQEGALGGLLGFEPLGFVEASLPIVLFCVLFGLSMDYEVFLLSRIREAYLESGSNRESVAQGLERSGRIITSAAAIIVLVSGSFVAADIILIKALGLGTAIAVFLDATVVRALLVPATMRLLGDWNWWMPGTLSSEKLRVKREE